MGNTWGKVGLDPDSDREWSRQNVSDVDIPNDPGLQAALPVANNLRNSGQNDKT
jgi:hypothetical protein